MTSTLDQPLVAPPVKLLLKPREAAAVLSVGKNTLWQLTNCGEIPCVRIGRCVRYDPNDLRAWVESKKSGGMQ